MNNYKYLYIWIVAIIIGILLVWYALPVGATATEKILICHRDEGKPEWKEIEIAISAWDAHEEHGDYKGECEVISPTPTVTIAPDPTPSATPSATPTEEPKRGTDPKGPPEWENPCFYLRDNPECKTKSEIFVGEDEFAGPQK